MSQVLTFVDDVAVRRVKGSITIDSAIERRSTAHFTVYDPDGTLSFSRGQRVDIVKALVPPFMYTLFSGVIGPKPRERRVPHSTIVYHDLACMDWHYLADKRLAVRAWVATEYENYTAGDDGAASVFGVNWYGQTMPTATSHDLSKIRLRLYRVGSPGTVTVSLRAVDGGLDPTGPDLAVGTIDGNALTAATAGEFVDINVTTPYARVSGTTYALVVRATGGDATNYVGWRKNSGAGFASGEYEASGDSGATWTPDAGQDFMFETWYYPTAGIIATDLHSEYLAGEGVVLGTIQAGPDIKEILINYQMVSRAYDALAVRAGFIWEIDCFKQLHFQGRTTTTAPFAVVAADVQDPSSSLTGDSTRYRNRQYIRAGRDVTESQVETFTGDGVQGAFTVGYPMNQEPTVTVNAVAQTVGIKGIDTTQDCYWSKGDSVLVFDAGSIPGAVAVVITYIGEYDIMTVVEDAGEIAARATVEGSTGIIEAIADEPYMNSKDSSLEAGQALLDKYGVIGQQFVYAIRDWGLAPGQIVTQTYGEYGLAAAELLIESVRIAEIGAGELAYTIKAITGPVMGDWTGFFGMLAAMRDEVVGRLNVGTDQILIVVRVIAGDWEITPVVTQTVFACPVPSVGLFPLVTLLPC